MRDYYTIPEIGENMNREAFIQHELRNDQHLRTLEGACVDHESYLDALADARERAGRRFDDRLRAMPNPAAYHPEGWGS